MEQLLRGHPSRIRLTDPEFRRLASGPADGPLLDKLRRTQLSRTTLIVKGLTGERPALGGAAELLAAAYDARPGAVGALLAHPWLGVWAADRLRGADGRPDYLANAALAAAALAGLDGVEVPLVPYRGMVAVPGFGVRPFPGARVVLRAADLARPGWLRPRPLLLRHGTDTLHLTVDDVDPYRDCFGVPPTARLSGARLADLAAALHDGWRLLTDHRPGFAAELAAGLTTLVPLDAPGEGRHSVTHADGYGAFAADPGLDAADLAVTMVHEFQHGKLSAALSLVALFDPTAGRRYYSPWRRDPRPVGGLVHGVYAFTAVAEVWSALRAEPALAERATRQFAEVRAQVRLALDEVSAADGLTGPGRLWLGWLAERCAALAAEEVPAGVERAAWEAVREAERAWRRP
ncbi:HEXXH motif-containing putative peptide modification protein [Longispora sp. K20-0274]|uniref:aKG-HExxH-type peptide beta-hydroxylase n=1 Tax=Longispora sp. K20-0274 TaxID=3088255 RepID=UPI00399BBE16